jgi:predicted TPR repeat methyltransferase
MKPERKRVSFSSMIGEAGEALHDTVIGQPKEWLKLAKERVKNLPKTNFELGVKFANEGHWTDALYRFRVTEYFQPDYPMLWLNVGSCYFRMGRNAEAKTALLKALKQTPNNQAAIFMLASIDPKSLPDGLKPERMPKEMVTGYFGAVANGYDLEEAKEKYQAGKVTYDLIKPFVNNAVPAVLDLGCGTGIASRPWRAGAGNITGVDFTPAMLAAADKANHADKKLFDTLIDADITQLPTSMQAASADAVLVVNVAQFIGELASLMAGAARAMKQGAALLITLEPYELNTGFGINTTSGRFGHSPAYVTQVAQAAGLALAKDEAVELYPTMPARALVFTKGTL